MRNFIICSLNLVLLERSNHQDDTGEIGSKFKGVEECIQNNVQKI
jgi:hypothetical protein